MNIVFVNPGFNPMIESIMGFQTEGESPYWSDSLFYFYPQLDRERFKRLTDNEKKNYLTIELKNIYDENESLYRNKDQRI